MHCSQGFALASDIMGPDVRVYRLHAKSLGRSRAGKISSRLGISFSSPGPGDLNTASKATNSLLRCLPVEGHDLLHSAAASETPSVNLWVRDWNES